MLEPEKSRKTGWARVAFGEVVNLSKARSKDPESGGYERVVGLEHIDPGDLRIRRWADISNGTTFTSVFRSGQVLFGKRRAYQRKVAVAEFTGVCSGDIYVLEPSGNALMPELLPFICQTDAFFEHAVRTSAGSLSPRTNWKSLSSFEFLLPPIQEQARLLEVLLAVKKLVENLVDTERGAENTYEAWIADEMRDLEWPEYIAMDVLERATVGIVVKPAALYVADDSGVPALRSMNVLKNRLSWDNCVRISDEGHAKDFNRY